MRAPPSLLLVGLIFLLPLPAAATVIVFQDNRAGFDTAAGAVVPTRIDFDTIAAGTDLAGTSVAGASFSSPDGNTLEVVAGASTFTPAGFTGVVDANTNRLFPTSGSNVLSPGGTTLAPGSSLVERDSLEIVFATPQLAVGLDILFQSLDSGPNTSVEVFDLSGSSTGFLAVSGSGAGGSPAGSVFVGFVSDQVSTRISRLVVSESDGNAQFPDSNIGYDTLSYMVPEPTTALLTLLGLMQLGVLGRRPRARRSQIRRDRPCQYRSRSLRV